MRSLRAWIVCEDADLRGRIEELLRERREVETTQVLSHYPLGCETARRLAVSVPDLVLLAIERVQAITEFLRDLNASVPGVPVIGISRVLDSRALAELMRLGVRDCVAVPLQRIPFRHALQRVLYDYKEADQRARAGPLICFLPARGGSGASTLACNVSARMAASPGARVLLADLDLVSGLSRFIFRLTPASSIMDALARSPAMDTFNWEQCIAQAGPLGILHRGALGQGQSLQARHVADLIGWARGHFTAVCADMTGGMEAYSIELLRRARTILLVCSGEGPALELAKEKLDLLAQFDLRQRTRVLITVGPGWGSAAPATGITTPVSEPFDFGERRVQECVARGVLIDRSTNLGRRIERLAADLYAEVTASPSSSVQ